VNNIQAAYFSELEKRGINQGPVADAVKIDGARERQATKIFASSLRNQDHTLAFVVPYKFHLFDIPLPLKHRASEGVYVGKPENKPNN